MQRIGAYRVIDHVFYLHSLKTSFPCVNLYISQVFQGVSVDNLYLGCALV